MKKWILWLFFLIILIIGGIGTYLYIGTTKSMEVDKSKAIEIAMTQTKLMTVEDFSVYNGKESYYVVKGKNNQDVDIYVLINKETQKVVVKQLRHGISKEEALAKAFSTIPSSHVKVQLGIENHIVLWEITYLNEANKLNYYYIDFETGELLKKIENL